MGVTKSPWHTLALGNPPGAFGNDPGAFNSDFFIPWQLTGGRGCLRELKAKAGVTVKSKVKVKIKVKKLIYLESRETHEFQKIFFEIFFQHN